MLDQVKDTNEVGMHQLFKVLEFPCFVKEASQVSAEEAKELPATSFAWPAEHMFPVHTKANTWLSAAYFQKYAADIPEQFCVGIQGNLDKAAQFWGIQLPTLPGPAEKDPGYIVKYAAGDWEHDVHVSSPDQLQKVADDALFPGKYPYAVRKSVARQILAAPENLRSDLGSYQAAALYKTAAYGVGLLKNAQHATKQRSINTETHWEHLNKSLAELDTILEKSASEEGLLSPEMLDKTASMLDAVDRFTKMHQRYGGGFQPPEQQLFQITMNDYDTFAKEAVHLPDGHIVSQAELRASSAGSWLQENFGYKVASQEDLMVVIGELPSRRAGMLYEHVQKEAYQAT